MDNKEIKKNILHISLFMLIVFFLLLCNLFYIQVVKADELAQHSLNRRGSMNDSTQRGDILDSNGNVIATSGEGFREYPMGAMMAHAVGYLGNEIGSAGVEQMYGNELSGQSRLLSKIGPLARLFQSDAGNDVKLTIDSYIQEIAYDSLEGSKGAVVVLDADTGAVIAMVSRPSFNPEGIDEAWDELSGRDDSPLLNRAVQGLYPPGSTMKVLIADAALDEKITDVGEIFDCEGVLEIGDSEIRESHGAVHGSLDLREALVHSCNVTFASLAIRMQGQGLAGAFDRFGFNKELDGDVGDARPHLPDFSSIGTGDLAQVGIGQGELLVSPLRMAMLASAYANDGVAMKPYIVDEVLSEGGTTIFKAKPEEWNVSTSSQRAAILSSFMGDVVKEGTGTGAYIEGVEVAGKTGTAENPAGDDHSWFIGTAKLADRNIAYAIIVENSGGGGVVAAPIAKRIINGML